MAAMTFTFQFDNSFIKIVQFLLQLLDFVLNGEARGGKFIRFLSGLCTHR